MIAEETKKQTWEEMGKKEEAVEYAGRVGGRTEQVAELGGPYEDVKGGAQGLCPGQGLWGMTMVMRS